MTRRSCFVSRTSWLISLSLVARIASAATPPTPASVPARAAASRAAAAAASPVFRASAIAAHMRFLADDRLEGRATGTRGHEIAARYVAARFEASGLEPAGDSSWFQTIAFRRARLEPGGASAAWTRDGRTHRLTFEDEFLMTPDYTRTDSRVTADVVFAGHGITAPELQVDDFAGLDVRGKIVCMLSGAPASFPNDQRAHYSHSRTKEMNLVAHGAVGYLTVRTPNDDGRQPWPRSVRQSRQGAMRWLDASGTPQDVRPTLLAGATLRRAAAESLFAGGPRSLADVFADDKRSEARGFELGARVELARRTRFESVTSPNVVALLRGSDPKLRDEAIVYTAHLDHLGITSPVDGDSINNGALDNASGIACLLEIARAFAESPHRPRRSIVFLAVTGEERGLLGSDYFVEHPTVPGLTIVANVNMDEFLMLFPVRDLTVYGAEHSTLGAIAAEAAKPLGFVIAPDPSPAEVSFVRSDQYSFVRRGVPSLAISAGRGSSRPDVDANELVEQWLQTRYHSPSDDMSQSFDWPSIVRYARLNYRIGERIANDPSRPAWRPGDFFGTTYGAARH